MREARRANGVIEFVPQVGDFVASEEPLFVLYGGVVAMGDDDLRATVAFGVERTIEQDPLFAFRILVDIALKALSPAINDPTTAVLALDQIHRLLRVVGNRPLRSESIADAVGVLRVIYRTPNWEDSVHLSCHEIRASCRQRPGCAAHAGAARQSCLVAAAVPPRSALPADQTTGQYDQSLYPIPEDLALARIPDSQGLGGSSGRRIST